MSAGRANATMSESAAAPSIELRRAESPARAGAGGRGVPRVRGQPRRRPVLPELRRRAGDAARRLRARPPASCCSPTSTAQLAGCGALRPLADVDYANACEMKRLLRAARLSPLRPRPAARPGAARRSAAAPATRRCCSTPSTTWRRRASSTPRSASRRFRPYYFNPIPGAHYLKADLTDVVEPDANHRTPRRGAAPRLPARPRRRRRRALASRDADPALDRAGARSKARARRRCSRCCRIRTGSATGAFAGRAATTRPAPTSTTRRIRCTASAGSGRGGSSPRARSSWCSARHAGDADWPFAFEARQYFTLTPESFSARLQLTNTGEIEQPAGLGLHPVLRQAAAQPAARRGCRTAGRPTPPSCRPARSRSRASTPTCRISTTTTASKAGAAGRGSATSASRCSWSRSCPISSSTRRRSATTSASSR